MNKRNAGFSLVELIVVVSMIAVLGAVGAGWIVRISGYRVRETTSKITNSLTAAKVKVISKQQISGDGEWILDRDPNNNRYYVTVRIPNYNNGAIVSYDEDVTRVSRSNIVDVAYTVKGNSTPIKIGEDVTSLTMRWNRNTGGFYDASQPDKVSKVETIIVSGGGKEYTIKLVPFTGKVQGRN